MPQATAKRSTIKVKCGECGKTIRVPGSHAGRKGKCPGCDTVIRIPGAKSKTRQRTSRSKTRQRTSRSKTRQQTSRSKPKPRSKSMPCPVCTESIKRDASKCRHCGEWFDEDHPDAPQSENNALSEETGLSTMQKIRLGILLVKGILILCYVIWG